MTLNFRVRAFQNTCEDWRTLNGLVSFCGRDFHSKKDCIVLIAENHENGGQVLGLLVADVRLALFHPKSGEKRRTALVHGPKCQFEDISRALLEKLEIELFRRGVTFVYSLIPSEFQSVQTMFEHFNFSPMFSSPVHLVDINRLSRICKIFKYEISLSKIADGDANRYLRSLKSNSFLYADSNDDCFVYRAARKKTTLHIIISKNFTMKTFRTNSTVKFRLKFFFRMLLHKLFPFFFDKPLDLRQNLVVAKAFPMTCSPKIGPRRFASLFEACLLWASADLAGTVDVLLLHTANQMTGLGAVYAGFMKQSKLISNIEFSTHVVGKVLDSNKYAEAVWAAQQNYWYFNVNKI